MKILLITIGLLLLVGCATGLVFTFQALGDTEDKLQKTQDDIDNLQIELQDTQSDLTEARAESQDTATQLTDAKNSLEEQSRETTKYINM